MRIADKVRLALSRRGPLTIHQISNLCALNPNGVKKTVPDMPDVIVVGKDGRQYIYGLRPDIQIPSPHESLQQKVHRLLREHPDGLTTGQLLEMTQILDRNRIQIALGAIPEAYVDRWTRGEKARTGNWSAVWCLADDPKNVPQHCPKPERISR